MEADNIDTSKPINNQQINPSSIFAYLKIRGLGRTSGHLAERQFTAFKWLAYWEIIKEYYANKQEGIGAVIHNTGVIKTVDTLTLFNTNTGGTTIIPKTPAQINHQIQIAEQLDIAYTGTQPNANDILINGVYQNNVNVTLPINQIFGTIADMGTHLLARDLILNQNFCVS